MATNERNMYVPEALLAEVQKRAEAEQRSPEEVVADAVERYLRLKRREKLYAFGEEQAHKLGIRERDVPELVKQTRREIKHGC